jgi:hypothetical protein
LPASWIAAILMQDEFLHPQIADLPHVKRIPAPAIDGIHSPELFQ